MRPDFLPATPLASAAVALVTAAPEASPASAEPCGRPIPPPGSGLLLYPLEAAFVLALSVRTLESLRLRGGGPRYVTLGRAVRYRREDLDAWIGARVRANTSQKAG